MLWTLLESSFQVSMIAKESSLYGLGRSSSGRENIVLALKIPSWAVELAFSFSAEGFPLGPCIKGFSAFSQVDGRIRLLIKSINKACK